MRARPLLLGPRAAAIQAAAGRRHHPQRSFGLYRLEILAALANAVLLIGVAAYVVYEAVRRLQDPPEVVATGMLVVAVLGLVVNLVALLLLRTGAGESLNVHGAYLEVVADALGSVGVIVAAVILVTTGWPYADPLIAAGIGLFIVARSTRPAGPCASSCRSHRRTSPSKPSAVTSPASMQSSTPTTCMCGR